MQNAEIRRHWAYVRTTQGFAVVETPEGKLPSGYKPIEEMTRPEALRRAYLIWSEEELRKPFDPRLEKTIAGTD